MGVNSTLGVTFSIGTKAAHSNQSEYEADTYALVGEIENIGDFGDNFNPVNFTSLTDGRVRKFKGTRDAGTVSLTLGMDISNAGQDALTAALEDAGSDDYNFKVVFTDGDADASPVVAATTVYFSGKIMSRVYQTGGADNIVRVMVDVAINTGIVEVEAA